MALGPVECCIGRSWLLLSSGCNRSGCLLRVQIDSYRKSIPMPDTNGMYVQVPVSNLHPCSGACCHPLPCETRTTKRDVADLDQVPVLRLDLVVDCDGQQWESRARLTLTCIWTGLQCQSVFPYSYHISIQTLGPAAISVPISDPNVSLHGTQNRFPVPFQVQIQSREAHVLAPACHAPQYLKTFWTWILVSICTSVCDLCQASEVRHNGSFSRCMHGCCSRHALTPSYIITTRYHMVKSSDTNPDAFSDPDAKIRIRVLNRTETHMDAAQVGQAPHLQLDQNLSAQRWH